MIYLLLCLTYFNQYNMDRYYDHFSWGFWHEAGPLLRLLESLLVSGLRMVNQN